jgi:hypothetical protein
MDIPEVSILYFSKIIKFLRMILRNLVFFKIYKIVTFSGFDLSETQFLYENGSSHREEFFPSWNCYEHKSNLEKVTF